MASCQRASCWRAPRPPVGAETAGCCGATSGGFGSRRLSRRSCRAGAAPAGGRAGSGCRGRGGARRRDRRLVPRPPDAAAQQAAASAAGGCLGRSCRLLRRRAAGGQRMPWPRRGEAPRPPVGAETVGCCGAIGGDFGSRRLSRRATADGRPRATAAGRPRETPGDARRGREDASPRRVSRRCGGLPSRSGPSRRRCSGWPSRGHVRRARLSRRCGRDRRGGAGRSRA